MQDAKLGVRRFDNDADCHSALLAALQPFDVSLVVMEATGGYEAALACALQAAGLAVAVVNPQQARDFAKSMGQLPRPMASTRAPLADLAGVFVVPDWRASFARCPTTSSSRWLRWSRAGANF